MADWQGKAAAKRECLKTSIPPEWVIPDVSPATVPRAIEFPFDKYLSASELEITSLYAEELLSRIAKGQYKAVDVARAFAHRAAIAHQLVNCCIEFFWDKAERQARDLDEYYAAHGRVIGPLHGLPISLKGVETSMCYVGWLGHVETNDSVFTDLLRTLGAPVKTTVPQSLMCGETVNNITGVTVNPYSNKLSCGGSSGGEGALIALRGSVIGLGTDIGGSIRIPAGFNALYGLRPSHGRMPYNTLANSMEGQETVHSVVGPLAHSAADIRCLIKAVLSSEPWLRDPKCIELPWREDHVNAVRGGSLTLGIMTWDGLAMPHPPVQRGMRMVEEALKRAGHELLDFYLPDTAQADTLSGRIYRADGGKDISDACALSGEPTIPNIKGIVALDNRAITINELWNLQSEKTAYQKKVLEAWNSTSERTKSGKIMDAFIMPVAPFAAVAHNNYDHVGYTTIINLLDYTSCVVPVTFADKEIDKRDASYKPVSPLDKLVWEKCVSIPGLLMADDPDVYHLAPVSVQVVGRRLREEQVIEIADALSSALQRAKYPQDN